jgi:hypothetical protein
MRIIAAAAFALMIAGAAEARVPSTKTVIPPSTGARVDITVPYTTNGRSTLGVYNGVGPLIYSTPSISAKGSPGGLPVFNLPFYGGRIMTGNGLIGAGPVEPNILRRNR